MTFEENIFYLENDDLDLNGNLNFESKMPIIIMIQSKTCTYSQQAIPIYQSVANEAKNAMFCTIQIDGNPSEQKLGQRISKFIPGFRGVPTFIHYDAQGNFKGEYKGNRGTEKMLTWAKSL